MPMGITRVSDQYGYLPEAERHREYLAAHEDEARQIAAAHQGYRIPTGTNDPRRHAAVEPAVHCHGRIACDCEDDEDGDPDDGFGGKKAPPFGKKDAQRLFAQDERF